MRRGIRNLFNGADLARFGESVEAQKNLGDAADYLFPLAAWFLDPADPIHHVARIAPRPVLIQNGRHDRVIPKPAAMALMEAAAEPKTVIWYDSDHVGLDRAHVEAVLADVLAWLERVDGPVASSVPLPR